MQTNCQLRLQAQVDRLWDVPEPSTVVLDPGRLHHLGTAHAVLTGPFVEGVLQGVELPDERPRRGARRDLSFAVDRGDADVVEARQRHLGGLHDGLEGLLHRLGPADRASCLSERGRKCLFVHVPCLRTSRARMSRVHRLASLDHDTVHT